MWLIFQPETYRCSAASCPHAMLAISFFFLFHRLKHEWSICRFRSWWQTSMFVFICATSCAQQWVASSTLVPIFRACSSKCCCVKRLLLKSVKHYYHKPTELRKMWWITDTCQLLTRCTTVAAALDFLLTVFTIKIILTGRTGIYCKAKYSFQGMLHLITARPTMSKISRQTKTPSHFWRTSFAHLNNFAMACWQEPPLSGSLPCERMAVGVAVCKLSFLQPLEFSSSDNRK